MISYVFTQPAGVFLYHLHRPDLNPISHSGDFGNCLLDYCIAYSKAVGQAGNKGLVVVMPVCWRLYFLKCKSGCCECSVIDGITIGIIISIFQMSKRIWFVGGLSVSIYIINSNTIGCLSCMIISPQSICIRHA